MIPGRMYISGSLNDEGWRFIQQHINVVINLRTNPDVPSVESQHTTYYWFPLTIWVTPSLEWTIQFIELIHDLFNKRQRILIHDRFGIQRLGFAITAFFMRYFHLRRDEALKMVRQYKQDIEPTPNYMDLLLEYERYLFGH